MGWGQERHSVCFQRENKSTQRGKSERREAESDRTRPLLSAPNPRAGSGNDMGLDEMNDERDKTAAVT